MSELLGLEDAQARLLALVPPRPSSLLPIAPVALQRYLASDITALRTQPAADLSAMDGYAVAPGPGPWRRVGESRAGAPYAATLEAGECVRISTGAIVPQGASAVLLQEAAVIDGERVQTADDLPPGKHIRRAGFDFGEGDTVLTKGTAYSPAVIALAAAAGHGALPWVEPPRVAILDSGDELVAPGQPCGLHQIPASNGVMLGAMVEPLVGEVAMLGPVADDRDALAAALARADGSDVLITSGGASVGDHDLIQQALKDWGANIAFWKIAIKPGKPLMVATCSGAHGPQVILGLPGNPVSSFVTAFLFALPLLRAAMGDPSPLPRAQMLTAAEPLPAVGKRREFLRAISDAAGGVRLAGSQDSSALSALAIADCLIDRPAGAAAVAIGEPVRVFSLRNG